MFRTELPIAPATEQFPRTARVLTMGSCFADSIGTRLATNKVAALVNPFGTVFQPLALGQLLRAAAGEEVDWQQHLVQARGRWQSYDLHGSIGAESPVDLLQHIQELVRRTGDFLRQADVVLLTLGTAWAYRLRETGELVNNCHKQPADLFVRELLTPDEIINNLAETHAYLRRINPKLRFVLTVSPVRHLKDTLPLNAVSKSVLRVATHILSDLLPGVAYFPAYELLVDDLRDYRFYAADMLHPSEVAEDYIWEKFARTYFDSEFGRFRKEWASVRQSLNHRPLHAGAPEHRQFLETTLQKLEQLSLRRVEVSEELQDVRSRLDALPLPPPPAPVVEDEDDEERIDIGEGATAPATTEARPMAPSPAADGRMPRLSPEEFRSQRAGRKGRPERGRRDGRGKGQEAPLTENEEFQSPEIFATESVAELAEDTLEKAVAALNLAGQSVESTLAVPVEERGELAAGQEPVKKKKRRSRGGAKRTARKHALRLAEELGQVNAPTVEASEGLATPATTAPAAKELPEVRKQSVIQKSTPVKRGGRRDESGRVPRVPLFAAPQAAEVPAPSVDAALPTALPVESVEAPIAVDNLVQPASEATARSSSRNNRNRKKNKQGPPAEVALGGDDVATRPVGTAQELGGLAETPTQTPAAPAPSPLLGAENTSPAPDATSGVTEQAPARQAPARRSNRAKRVVTGARTEKPAVDTPVVPVPDASEVRTTVAAGRMTGSSAKLVAADETPPAAKAPKASVPKKKPAKPAAPKAAPAPAAETPATQPEATPAAPAAPKPPRRKAPAKPKSAKTADAAAKPKPPRAKATKKPKDAS